MGRRGKPKTEVEKINAITALYNSATIAMITRRHSQVAQSSPQIDEQKVATAKYLEENYHLWQGKYWAQRRLKKAHSGYETTKTEYDQRTPQRQQPQEHAPEISDLDRRIKEATEIIEVVDPTRHRIKEDSFYLVDLVDDASPSVTPFGNARKMVLHDHSHKALNGVQRHFLQKTLKPGKGSVYITRTLEELKSDH